MLSNIIQYTYDKDIDFDLKPLIFKILCFGLALGSHQLSIIAKVENLGYKSWLSVCNAEESMVIVELQICFDSSRRCQNLQRCQNKEVPKQNPPKAGGAKISTRQ